MRGELNEYGQVVAGHLGGYVPGGDPNTTAPDVWAMLIERQAVRSMIDVGCGDGATVRWFQDHGVAAVGIDGLNDRDDPFIVVHDYTEGPLPKDPRRPREFDLVWSAEFVEHVEERYVPNFLDTFRAGKLVVFTHAVPGQGGWHHVNCRTGDYWIGAMAAVGYAVDWPLTGWIRDLAPPGSYVHRTGLAFRRIG